jgi:tyrosyl-tRNA synthetase
MPEHALAGHVSVLDAIVAAGVARSKSEARRLVEQGGVYIDGMRIEEAEAGVTPRPGGSVLRVGRRRFVRLVQG